MERAVISLLAGGFAIWYLFAVLIAVGLGVAWPLMAWSTTRNIKGIRAELARLNTNLERLPAPRASGNGSAHVEIDPPTYIPGTHTRTGPLDIR